MNRHSRRQAGLRIPRALEMACHVRIRQQIGSALRIALALLLVLTAASPAGAAGKKSKPAFAPRVADFDARFATLPRITLLPPRVEIYEITAGSVAEEKLEWSDAARAVLVESLEGLTRAIRGHEIVAYVPVGVGETGNLEQAGRTVHPETETWAMYTAVSSAIQAHGLPGRANTFPAKIADWRYTLGSQVRDTLATTDAEVALLVTARDWIGTAGHAALQAGAVLTSLLTGLYTGPSPAPPAYIEMALVEVATGDVLWWSQQLSSSADLRDPKSQLELAFEVMKTLETPR